MRLTSPARLGLPLNEELAELSELMEDALGLLLRRDLRWELLVLVGVVQGKPIRVTLWTGANRPYLGMHWKYLRGAQRVWLQPKHTHRRRATSCAVVLVLLPGPCYRTIVLAKRFV